MTDVKEKIRDIKRDIDELYDRIEELERKVKTESDIQEIIVKFMKTKGWEYV